MTDRFGFYRDKSHDGYIAVDEGSTFVTTVASSVRREDQAQRLCHLANDQLTFLNASLWRRLRLAITRGARG